MITVNEFLTENRAKSCAKEIIAAFAEKGSNESIEVDFNISKGKMVESLDRPNTWFKFDCRDSGGALQEVFEFLTQLWQNDSTTEEDSHKVKEFENLVTDQLRYQVKTGELGDILRRVLFKQIPKAILPIDKINFHRVEFAGEDEQGYLLRVQKFAKVDGDTGEYSEQPQSVSKELIEIHTETGRDFKDIIEEKRLSGDPKYKFVADAHLERYIRDVTVILSADYSFCQNPAIEAS